jgi:hypothetical protein
MITILTGAPGHGKSYTSVKMIDEFVHKGKPVVTNVPLRSDFALQMALHHTPLGRIRKGAVARRQARIAELVHVTEDLDDILRVRFAGEGEGRAAVVIDEAHRIMNVRGSTRAASPEGIRRKLIIAWISAHRHYGCDVVLITQDLGNLDRQARTLLEFHSEVRNFRRLPLLGKLAKLFPGGNLFLRTTVWNDRARTKAGVAVYGLSKRLACLYDTHAYAALDMPVDPIMLPSPPNDRPVERPGIEVSGDSRDNEVCTQTDIPTGHMQSQDPSVYGQSLDEQYESLHEDQESVQLST